jgi:hypothetical protein
MLCTVTSSIGAAIPAGYGARLRRGLSRADVGLSRADVGLSRADVGLSRAVPGNRSTKSIRYEEPSWSP